MRSILIDVVQLHVNAPNFDSELSIMLTQAIKKKYPKVDVPGSDDVRKIINYLKDTIRDFRDEKRGKVNVGFGEMGNELFMLFNDLEDNGISVIGMTTVEGSDHLLVSNRIVRDENGQFNLWTE